MRNEKYFVDEKYFPAGMLWSEVVQGLGHGRPQPDQPHPPRVVGRLRARLLLQSGCCWLWSEHSQPKSGAGQEYS